MAPTATNDRRNIESVLPSSIIVPLAFFRYLMLKSKFVGLPLRFIATVRWLAVRSRA